MTNFYTYCTDTLFESGIEMLVYDYYRSKNIKKVQSSQKSDLQLLKPGIVFINYRDFQQTKINAFITNKSVFTKTILFMDDHAKLNPMIDYSLFDGIIANQDKSKVIQNAINEVLKNKKFISPQIQKNLHERSHNQLNIKISNREWEVIELIKSGMTSKEISEKLALSYHTIVAHKKNIFKKFGENSTLGLLKALEDLGVD
ncbi:MAG: LuxR C-terminal-related transcriptional regulator [Flavobacteriales bacterium]|jgi:DNA-binding NarL/FixJ family response regulator|nr:LuxR C-terminal-related transcriptional regulator [Flavobacteriales bacterium]